MRSLRTALLLLALSLPAAAQEEQKWDGLLVYGAVGSAHLGAALSNAEHRAGIGSYAEFDALDVGIGGRIGHFGVLASTSAFTLSPGVAPGVWLFNAGSLPVVAHFIYGGPDLWKSGRPTIDAYFAYAPLANIPYTEAGIKTRWRLWVVSPTLRAAWRWPGERRWGIRDLSLTAGIELGGIWALGR